MREEHAALLVCPRCSSELRLGVDERLPQGGVMAGRLGCARCGDSFPVIGGIPRFVPADNYASGFGLQWKLHAATQLDSRNGTNLSQTRFFAETRWPRDLRGKLVLEVGSGAGRFTEQAASTGATVVSLDYSTAVEANFATNGHLPNVLIAQADLYRMPVRPRSFDRVVCLGVIQHTPDPERSFQALARQPRSGGALAIDVYRRPRGWARLRKTRYWVRPLTRRIPAERLYLWTKRYVAAMWPLARMIRRIPRG